MLSALLALILAVNTMPALVTTPPILADPIAFSRQSGVEINPFVFVKGTHAYEVLTGNTGLLSVFKSTAAGVTTASLDQANAPLIQSGTFVCYSNPSSSVITIAFAQSGTNNLGIVDFDTATDTYGTAHVSGTSGVFARGAGVFFRPSNSSYYHVYAAAGTGQLKYIKMTAGVFAAPVNITAAETGGQGQFYAAFDPTSNIALLFYLLSTATQKFNCVSLDASDTVGVPVTITSDGVEWVDATINSGTLSVVWVNQDGTKVNVSASAVSTTPAFPATNLKTVAAPVGLSYPSITLDWTGALTAFWCVGDRSFNPGVDEVDYSQLIAGVWTAPAQFYDAITNPPAGGLPYPSQFVHTLQVATISNGWVGVTAMETGFCTGFILVVPGIPTPPATPVVINPGPAGRKPVPLLPNQFDFCLHRESRLYCAIDVARLSCANIPECFSVDEREWGAAS